MRKTAFTVTCLYIIVFFIMSGIAFSSVCQPEPNPGQCLLKIGCGVICGKVECEANYNPCAAEALKICNTCEASCNLPPCNPQVTCGTPYQAQEKACISGALGVKSIVQGSPCQDTIAPDPCSTCRLKANCQLTKKQLDDGVSKQGFLDHAEKLPQKMDMDNLMKMAELAKGFMDQGGKGKSGDVSATPGGDFRPTVNPDGDIEFGGNVFNRDQLKGQDVNFNTKDGSTTFSKEGQSVTILKNPNPSQGMDRITLPDQIISPGGFAAQITQPNQASVVLKSKSTVTDPEVRGVRVTPTGQQGPQTPTGQWLYGSQPAFTLVRFFPDDPPLATLNEVTVGRLPPSFIKIVPRSNVKIDLFAGQAVISSLVQQFGLPRGLSTMAKPENLLAESNNKFDVDGRGDFDFILANGLVRWTRSGTPGGKIISSSFGVPPNEYLSSQQRELVYG